MRHSSRRWHSAKLIPFKVIFPCLYKFIRCIISDLAFQRKHGLGSTVVESLLHISHTILRQWIQYTVMKLPWCKGHRRSSAFLSQSLIKIGWCLKLTWLVRWRCLHQLHKSWLHSMQWWFTLSKLPHKSHGLFLLITVPSWVNVFWCVFFRVDNSLYSQLKSWVFILPSQLLSIFLGIKNFSSLKKKLIFVPIIVTLA